MYGMNFRVVNKNRSLIIKIKNIVYIDVIKRFKRKILYKVIYSGKYL